MFGEVLKIGDKVVVNITDDNWEWGYRPFPKQKGTVATVSGFGIVYVTRTQTFGKEPGLYVNHEWVQLKELSSPISACFLDWKDKKAGKQREDKFNLSEFKSSEKPIAPLPDTKFWEKDIVRFKDGRTNPWGKGNVEIAVLRYENIGKMRNDGVTPMPECSICPVGSEGCFCDVNEADLELVSRGNVWKYFHSKKIDFKDIKEEAEFHALIGRLKEVRNPKTGFYSWTFRRVVEAIRGGTVDVMSVCGGIGGIQFKEIKHFAQRFDDRELGERVRAHSIEGFKDAHFCGHKGCDNYGKNKVIGKHGEVMYRCDEHK